MLDTLGYFFVISAVGLTLVGYTIKRVVIAAGGAFGWLLVGLWGYNQSTATWDLFYGLFWFGIGLFLAIVVDLIWMIVQQQNQEAREEMQMEQTEKRDEIREYKQEQFEKLSEADQLRVKHGLKPSEARKRRQNNRMYGWR